MQASSTHLSLILLLLTLSILARMSFMPFSPTSQQFKNPMMYISPIPTTTPSVSSFLFTHFPSLINTGMINCSYSIFNLQNSSPSTSALDIIDINSAMWKFKPDLLSCSTIFSNASAVRSHIPSPQRCAYLLKLRSPFVPMILSLRSSPKLPQPLTLSTSNMDCIISTSLLRLFLFQRNCISRKLSMKVNDVVMFLSRLISKMLQIWIRNLIQLLLTYFNFFAKIVENDQRMSSMPYCCRSFGRDLRKLYMSLYISFLDCFSQRYTWPMSEECSVKMPRLKTQISIIKFLIFLAFIRISIAKQDGISADQLRMVFMIYFPLAQLSQVGSYIMVRKEVKAASSFLYIKVIILLFGKRNRMEFELGYL